MDNNEFQHSTDTEINDNTQIDFANEIEHNDVVKTYSSTPIVLGIIGLLGFFIPLIGYCTAIPGIVISSKRKKDPEILKLKLDLYYVLLLL